MNEGTTMDRVEIEAVEDRTRPEGGHAVILLRSITDIGGTGRFRLKALDDQGTVPGLKSLLDRTHEPLAVRPTSDGVALDIGPGLADSPYLIPGMGLELTLVDLDRSGEFLWPIVTPLARPKRRNIMTRPPLAETTAAAPIAHANLPPAHGTEHGAPQVDEARIVAPERPESDRPVEAEPAAPVVAETPACEVAVQTRSDDASSAAAAAMPALSPAPSSGAQTERAYAPADTPAEDARRATDAPSSAPRPAAEPRALVPPEGAAGRPAPAPARPVAARGLSPLSAAAVAAGVLLAGQFAALRLMDLNVVKRAPAVAPISSSAPPKPAERPFATVGVFDLLATGPVSPRGVAADTVSPARALELAHLHQHGVESQRDRDEAVYWLKRYVKATVGSEPQRIALTQLGSAYARPSFKAEPDGKRDLAKAIVAWELAGALGDTVAICFLATLHAQGIGVPVDKTQADLWLSRASQAQCALPGRSAQ